MPESHNNHSEVARLLSQIRAEYAAAELGLSGFAQGASQHHFITARMEQMSRLHTELQMLVGDTAIALVAAQLEACPEDPSGPQKNQAQQSFHQEEDSKCPGIIR